MNAAPESPIKGNVRIYKHLTPLLLWQRLCLFVSGNRSTDTYPPYLDVDQGSTAYGNFIHWMANHRKRNHVKPS